MNNAIVQYFKITEKKNDLYFESSEKVSRDIKMALLVDSDFYLDIQQNFHFYPKVITMIWFKDKADISKFLQINSIRKICESAMQLETVPLSLVEGSNLKL